MYYQMTRLHFEARRFPDLIEWTEMQRDRIESIEGLVTWTLCRGGPSDGMVISAYREEEAYQSASDLVARVFEEMEDYLTNTPHGHDGTAVLSFGG